MMIRAVANLRLGRSDLSIILLLLSWPVCLVHRFWNNSPASSVSWFVFPVKDEVTGELISQDIQYYVFDTGNMLSFSFILLSFILLRKKTADYSLALGATFLISIIDIAHYWLWYKQNEVIVTLESLIMILTSLLIIIRNTRWKKL